VRKEGSYSNPTENSKRNALAGRQKRKEVDENRNVSGKFVAGKEGDPYKGLGYAKNYGGGSKTRKYSKLKLKNPKKIERKYKQSFKNKVKLNHSQKNRVNLLNKYLDNKTKKHLRLKLKEKKKPIKKYKKSLKK